MKLRTDIDIPHREYPPPYFMAVILTARATDSEKQGASHELECLKRIAMTIDDSPEERNKWDVPYLIDYFEMDGPHGRHLCLIMRPLSPNLESQLFSTLQHVTSSVASSLTFPNRLDMVHLSKRNRLLKGWTNFPLQTWTLSLSAFSQSMIIRVNHPSRKWDPVCSPR
jgi:hypothetical protein